MLSAYSRSTLDYACSTKYNGIWNSHPQRTEVKFSKLFKHNVETENFETDLVVCIGATTFNCYLSILNANTSYFINSRKTENLSEKEVTPDAFNDIYLWMLDENRLLQREGIMETFRAANYLRISELIDQCWRIFIDEKLHHEETAFVLLTEAISYTDADTDIVKEIMINRIQKFFLTSVASHSFIHMSATDLCKLLDSDTIAVNTELEVFLAAVRWLNYKWEHRVPQLIRVMKCVRFNLLPMAFLMTMNKTIDCKEIQRVVLNTFVNEWIVNGITYTTTINIYGQKSKEFESMLRYNDKIEVPKKRLFLFDPQCKYHHLANCEMMNYVSIAYKSFNDYLENIQKVGPSYWRKFEENVMENATETQPTQCGGCENTFENLHLCEDFNY